MKTSELNQVNQEIYRKYPEFAGVKPQIQEVNTPNPRTAGMEFLLIYQQQATTADQRKMTRWLRVSVNGQGKITKVSTSR